MENEENLEIIVKTESQKLLIDLTNMLQSYCDNSVYGKHVIMSVISSVICSTVLNHLHLVSEKFEEEAFERLLNFLKTSINSVKYKENH